MGDFEADEQIMAITLAPISTYLSNVLKKETGTAAAMRVC